MKIMIFWLDFCFYTCLLLTGPLLDFGNHLSEETSEYSPLMLVKYEKAKEGNSKKETTNRPNHKKQKNKKKVRIQNQSGVGQ